MHTHPEHPNLLSPASEPSKPFLKWAGGKARLLTQLLPLMPPGARLIEPFVGAGSVFLAAEYDRYVINDANSDLVAVSAALQARPRDFVAAAQRFFIEENRNERAYARIRTEFNECSDRFERAIRLPYLNKFGFNGLYRVNSKGEFNVPYGKPERLPSMAIDAMAAASLKLQRATILNGGFRAAIDMAGVGDVVYCDPPYLASSTGASFTSYTKGSFGIEAHRDLLEDCLQAVSRGATVLISNHDTREVRDLYRGWDAIEVVARRSIASKSASRGLAREIVACLPSVDTWPRSISHEIVTP